MKSTKGELVKIAIIQITSVENYKVNLEKINSYIQQAKGQGAEAIFLPEVFYSISDGTKPTPYLIDGENEHFINIKELAKRNHVYLLGGSCATLYQGKIVNRCYNFNPNGDLLGTYDKINLFKLDLEQYQKKTLVDETTVYTAGFSPSLLEFEEWKMGLSICFDLRFPEMYRRYFKQGANLFTISSAFTIPTGKAHWEVLVRARAIENQAYVVACNQTGKNNEKISTWGHSLVVNPWGEIIASLNEEEGFCVCDIDITEVDKFRSRLNVFPNTL